MALSKRGMIAGKIVQSFTIWEVIRNLWDPETNPDGYINLGVAENHLMHEKLKHHIESHVDIPDSAFTYGDGATGSKRLRTAMSTFLTQRLKPVKSIEPDHITVTNGCTTAVEHLAWVLGNPGDAILIGQPYYGAFVADIKLRPKVDVVEVPFHGIDPFSLDAVQKYEDQILAAQAKGQKIAALLLSHPHNPLGRCYPCDTLVSLMRLCQKYQIHFICDEIYALSVWNNTVDSEPKPVKYESALSIALSTSSGEQIIDPSLVHLIWGPSKDFGASGLRIGAIISQSHPFMHQSLKAVAPYSYTSSLSEHVVANLLEDTSFTDSYIAENQRLLSEQHAYVANFVRDQGLEYTPGANAAFFLWVNLGKRYKENRPERTEFQDITEEVNHALLREKVFLANAKDFGNEEAGWFRIVFSQPQRCIEEGLKRMMKAVETSSVEKQLADGMDKLKPN